MTRRRFVFWLGMGLFWVSRKLEAQSIDALAADMMRTTEPADQRRNPVRWIAAENSEWRWHRQETRLGGKWILTGVTTPVQKTSGQLYTGQKGYLNERLVPPTTLRHDPAPAAEPGATTADDGPPQADDTRRANGGRPPSQWLRSLYADEIRIWLRTIRVPPVGASGMTMWTHLTRDHFFDATKIEGLSIAEQGKLHSAAHFGY
jgi:hypothetical protein